MSYDSIESSNFYAIPTAIYEFALGGNVWRYSSGETDIIVGGSLYTAVPVSDSGIIQSGDTQNDDYTVTLPSSVPFAALFIATPPPESIFVTVRRHNRGEAEAPIIWVGEVKSTKRASQVAIDIVCKTLTASLNRNGLRLSWGRGCPYALYDRNCRVNPAAFAIAVQVQGLTGASIISTGFAALAGGYLNGGYLEFPFMDGILERRAIESHGGTIINLMGTTDGLAPGDWITVYPGCDRVTSVCEGRFNNLANYGGFPHMPMKSPFDGDPVF